MLLDFWTRTSGTWINVATVALGTMLGLLLQGRLPTQMQRIITQGVALITLLLGTSMSSSLLKVQAGRVEGIILGLLCLVLGGLLGEWWQLEARLQVIGDWLKHRFRGSGHFTEGFITASLLFCIGPMTLIGSLNNGLTGNNALLTLKAVMDGLTAIALTSSFGIGVGCSILVIVVYQGGISLAAGLFAQLIPDPTTAPSILLITGIGGLMILGIGFNLLEMAQVRVASLLPALMLAPLILALAQWIG